MIKKDDSYHRSTPHQPFPTWQTRSASSRAQLGPGRVPRQSSALVVGYGDVIAMLRAAKDKGFLLDQLAIDPLPAPVRRYYRDRDGNDTGSSDEEAPKSREDESDEDEEASLG